MPWINTHKIAAPDSFVLVPMIAPRPLLMIVGTKTDTKWIAEEAFPKAREPKEKLWIKVRAMSISMTGTNMWRRP